MSAKSIVVSLVLLVSYTSLAAQESQTGATAQPSSSVYNRMRRPPATAGQQQQPQQARQTGQFPNPGQFPPEQHAASAATEQGRQVSVPSAQSSTQPGQAQSPSGQLAQPPQAQVPPTPSGPALQPPSPPRVSYSSGQLTVIANNSALSDIMSAIEHATGVRVEGTRPDAERVFGQFGPNSPRDVLNSLFSGSKYDFILTGSLDDPGGVQTIILSLHGAAAPSGPVAAATQPNPRPADNDDDEAPAYQGPISEAPQPLVNSSEAGPQRGQMEQQPQQQQQQQQVKTPEQLLQELQRLRQQQQQQQGQQPPPSVPR